MIYLQLFALALLSLYSTAFEDSIEDKGNHILVCSSALELGVIFDVSVSIPRRDFGEVKHALTTFLSQFKVGPKSLRVAFIPFENEIHPSYGFTLDRYNTLSEVVEHIEDLPHIGANLNRRVALTATYKALKYTREAMLSNDVTREGVKRACLVMTDGNSQKGSRTRREAQLLRESGVDVYAVGFGRDIGMTELLRIAGDESRVKRVRNLNDLEDEMADLSVKLCEKIPKPPCKERDIMFVFSPVELGKSLSIKAVDLVEALNQQTVATNNYTFGVASGVCPQDAGFSLGPDVSTGLQHYRQSHLTAITKVLKVTSPFVGRANASCNAAVLVVNELGVENLKINIRNLKSSGAEEVIVWNLWSTPVNDISAAHVINDIIDVRETARKIANTLNEKKE